MPRTGWALRQEQADRRHYERNKERIDAETIARHKAFQAAQDDLWAAFPRPWPTDPAALDAHHERAEAYRNERIKHHLTEAGLWPW